MSSSDFAYERKVIKVDTEPNSNMLENVNE